MKNLAEHFTEIDLIKIDSDYELLELKISKIDSILDYILSSNDISDMDIKNALNRVSWISIEIGNSKAFEASGKEKELVLKATNIARKFYSNDKNQLSKFLNFALLYIGIHDKMYYEIKNELQKLH